jgi:hypothetical protein
MHAMQVLNPFSNEHPSEMHKVGTRSQMVMRGCRIQQILVSAIFLLLAINPLLIDKATQNDGDFFGPAGIFSDGGSESSDDGKDKSPRGGNAVLSDVSTSQVSFYEDDWNDTGVIKVGLSVGDDGKAILNRPGITWNNPQFSLAISRTGAAVVAIPGSNLTWIMGGKHDPDPMQSGDEFFSSEIEIYNIETETTQNIAPMPKPAAYADAVIMNDNIVVIGDWWPGSSNPSITSKGQVLIYNFTNSSWWNGSSMPNGKEVGHAGVAALGQYIYVAGGVKNSQGTDAVNRTLRYDLANDSWAEVAHMNRSKFALALVPFHGKLYALGGGVKTISWGAPTPSKVIEVYDPTLDNWTHLNSTMPFTSSGLSGVVRHDEILVMGGTGVKKVASWNPETDTWRSFPDMLVSSADSAVLAINGTVHTFGGDMSNNPYSAWGAQFMDDIQRIEKVIMIDGFLISNMLDLRPATSANAQLRSINISAIEPENTSVTFQIRYGYDAITAGLRSWEGPDGTSQSWYEAGEYALNVPGITNSLQYKVRLATTALDNWIIPTLSNVSVEAAHAAFYAPLPAVIHPLGQSFLVSTEHADDAGTEFWLTLQPSASGGGGIGAATTLMLNGSVISIDDPQGLLNLLPSATTSVVGDTTFVDWNLSISDTQPSTHIMFRTGNLVPGQDIVSALNYLELVPVSIDQNLVVGISNLTINSTAVEIHDGAVMTDGQILDMQISAAFADGSTIEHGNFEWRVIGTTELTNGTGWDNWTEEWGIENNSLVFLPNEVSGFINLQLEVRTGLGIDLVWDGVDIDITSDGDNALLLSSVPANDSYVNSHQMQNVTALIGDSGGPDPNETEVFVWIEGNNDTNSDGIADFGEYYSSQWGLEGGNGLWFVNLSLDDSNNPDHGTVKVKIEGMDKAGRPIGEMGNGVIEFEWQTRDARLAQVLSLRNLTEEILGVGQLIEPNQIVGWSIDLSDYNSVSDITELTLTLGGDEDLGIRYVVETGVCMNLDGRLIPDKTSCHSTIISEVLTLDVEFAADWSFENQGLIPGQIDISAVDIDGVNDTWSKNSSWYLSKEVTSNTISLTENSGLVQGSIVNDYYAMPSDEVAWLIELIHSDSGKLVNGPFSLYWQGTIQGETWIGVSTVFAENGTITAVFQLPQSEGLLDATISIRDTADSTEIASLYLPAIHIDGTAPILQDSQKVIMESRYALNDVSVIVNILEAESWTGNLSISCQVRAISGDWSIVTFAATPDTIFGELVLFQYDMDIQNIGDASQLSDVANFACWVEGFDDAGNALELVEDGSNHQSSPWFSLLMPSNGPDLDVKLNWKQSMSELSIDKEILAEVVVTNLDETIDRQFNLTIWLQNGEEEPVVAFRNTRTNGLVSGREWIMGFGITPNATGDWTLTAMIDSGEKIAELNESNNVARANFSLNPESQGIIDILLSPSGLGGISLLVLVAITLVILRNKREADGSLTKAKSSAGPSSGPPSGPPAPRTKSSEGDKGGRKGPPPNLPHKSTSAAVSEELLPTMDIASAADALASISPSIEDIMPSFGVDNSAQLISRAENDGVEDAQDATDVTTGDNGNDANNANTNSVASSPSVLTVGATVSDWEQLPWGGEYEYRPEGTFYVGENIGIWKSIDEGKFIRVE